MIQYIAATSTVQLRTTSDSPPTPPTLLRYKSDTSPIIHRRIRSEVDRRKYGQDTVENGGNSLER